MQIGHTSTLSIDILYYAITKLCWAYQKEAWFLQSPANNHYAGFGPGTANMFRNMIGLPEAKWKARGEEQEREASPQHDLDVKQRTLSDFLD